MFSWAKWAGVAAVCAVLAFWAGRWSAPEASKSSVVSAEKNVTTEHIVITKPDQTTVTIDRVVQVEKTLDIPVNKEYNYSVGVMYPARFEQPKWGQPDVEVGRRIMGPVWGTASWSVERHEGAIGAKVEF
jgi:hypothetical protein